MNNKHFLPAHFTAVLIFLIAGTFQIKATNIKINKEATITDINTNDKTAFISFDLSWENSWRTSANEANYDAAWIFVKYKAKLGTEWKHVYISTDIKDYSVISDNGVAPSFSAGTTDKKGMGVFAYRQKDGNGNINWGGVKLKFNYDANGIKDINDMVFKVYAIEMVYVPKGAFKLGSGGSEASAFYTYPKTTQPFAVNSETAITTGQKEGNLCYAKHFYCEQFFGIIPDAFPKGYNAFWCMKYEITQGQYVDFLNSLTRQQQELRVWSGISGTNVVNRYVMTNSPTIQYRNGIRCDATISATDPVTFYCDLNGNGIPNENNDGQNISCNFISWADDAAFTDWAGLRPMTELEFEKACRGTMAPVANEFAWGTIKAINANGISNGGTFTELPSNADANIVYCEKTADMLSPVRAGFFEKKNGTNEQNGYSFYHISDLSGNLFERCISISNKAGILFKGSHGDGNLDESGNATNTDWPGVKGVGAGFRGGSFYYASTFCRTSDRQYAGLSDWQRYNHYGYRAVRSAE
ncbi:MAG: SUMF1/EgtB/PvdO family nonheme iron enzyme [Bacteroidales bacterium]|jgi:formylglycine-generating enzyme required for sulfatase activity